MHTLDLRTLRPMRWVWLVALAGCSFKPGIGAGSTVDANTGGDDAMRDGGTIEMGRCAPLPMPATSVSVTDVAGLRAALATAVAGTSIVLADGHYDVSSGITLSTAGVTIRSASNDASKVVLDGRSEEHTSELQSLV